MFGKIRQYFSSHASLDVAAILSNQFSQDYKTEMEQAEVDLKSLDNYLNCSLKDFSRLNIIIDGMSMEQYLAEFYNNSPKNELTLEQMNNFIDRLKVNIVVKDFIRYFCHQNGFLFFGTYVSVMKPAADLSIMLGDNEKHYELRSNRDGSVDFIEELTFTKPPDFNHSLAADTAEESEVSDNDHRKQNFLTYRAVSRISYTAADQINYQLKKVELTAYDKNAKSLLRKQPQVSLWRRLVSGVKRLLFREPASKHTAFEFKSMAALEQHQQELDFIQVAETTTDASKKMLKAKPSEYSYSRAFAEEVELPHPETPECDRQVELRHPKERQLEPIMKISPDKHEQSVFEKPSQATTSKTVQEKPSAKPKKEHKLRSILKDVSDLYNCNKADSLVNNTRNLRGSRSLDSLMVAKSAKRKMKPRSLFSCKEENDGNKENAAGQLVTAEENAAKPIEPVNKPAAITKFR